MLSGGRTYPRITVVTPSFNQAEFLEETIKSVLDQGYPNLEYFVVDGGSNDGSLEIIKRYRNQIDYWVSEPDSGQADAIQKGLVRATGVFFNWINSDDLLAEGALFAIAEAIEDNVDFVAGGIHYFGGAKEKTRFSSEISTAALLENYVGNKSCSWNQPGSWFRTDKLKESGGIEDSLHYCFDYFTTMRYLAQFPHVAYVNRVLAHFRLHDLSKTVSRPEAFDLEHDIILARMSNESWAAPYSAQLARIKVQRAWPERLNKALENAGSSRFVRIYALVRDVQSSNWITFDSKTRKTLRRMLFRGRPK